MSVAHGRTGVADLPPHGGRVPPWLADRMARLGPVIVPTPTEFVTWVADERAADATLGSRTVTSSRRAATRNLALPLKLTPSPSPSPSHAPARPRRSVA